LVCFVGFSCVTLYKGLSGEASCGCFGKVEISPWYTLVFDVLASGALVLWRPANVNSPDPAGPPVVRHWRRLSFPAAAIFLICLSAGYAMAGFEPTRVSDSGMIEGEGNLVVLEPEKWVGKPFPLIKYIDIGEQLRNGRWKVVLYHHDCQRCQEVIPIYERSAELLSTGWPKTPRIALIELPPFAQPGRSLISERSPCLSGRLANTFQWFLETPTIISLTNGNGDALIFDKPPQHLSRNTSGIYGQGGTVPPKSGAESELSHDQKNDRDTFSMKVIDSMEASKSLWEGLPAMAELVVPIGRQILALGISFAPASEYRASLPGGIHRVVMNHDARMALDIEMVYGKAAYVTQQAQSEFPIEVVPSHSFATLSPAVMDRIARCHNVNQHCLARTVSGVDPLSTFIDRKRYVQTLEQWQSGDSTAVDLNTRSFSITLCKVFCHSPDVLNKTKGCRLSDLLTMAPGLPQHATKHWRALDGYQCLADPRKELGSRMASAYRYLESPYLKCVTVLCL